MQQKLKFVDRKVHRDFMFQVIRLVLIIAQISLITVLRALCIRFVSTGFICVIVFVCNVVVATGSCK